MRSFKKKNPFIVNVNDLEILDDKTIHFNIEHKFELPEELCKLRDYVIGNVTLRKQNKFILITGNLEVPLIFVCDRCLNEYDFNLKFKIDDALEISTQNFDTQPELEISYENCFEIIRPNADIDVEDLIRQYIIINIPLKKICQIDCKGVQYTNKIEINNDPRWNDLIKIKENLELGRN